MTEGPAFPAFLVRPGLVSTLLQTVMYLAESSPRVHGYHGSDGEGN
jgi:hypothetical protein